MNILHRHGLPTPTLHADPHHVPSLSMFGSFVLRACTTPDVCATTLAAPAHETRGTDPHEPHRHASMESGTGSGARSWSVEVGGSSTEERLKRSLKTCISSSAYRFLTGRYSRAVGGIIDTNDGIPWASIRDDQVEHVNMLTWGDVASISSPVRTPLTSVTLN